MPELEPESLNGSVSDKVIAVAHCDVARGWLLS
jgi:hypothetical protein